MVVWNDQYRPPIELLPYQREALNDRARFCAYNWSRRSRKSWTITLKRLDRALERGRDCLMLSATKDQSAELIAKVRAHLGAFKAFVHYAYKELEEEFDDGVKYTKYVITLPNGARIMAMPARPESLRGYGGDIFLDEFGMHTDGEAVFAAAIFIAAQEDYECDIASTPTGKRHVFYRVMQNPEWHRVTIDIYEAVRQGLKIDVEKLRKIIDDEDIWAQEAECKFIDGATAYLPYELIQSCEDWNISQPIRDNLESPEEFAAKLDEFFRGFRAEGPLGLGFDVARTVDLSVIWLEELLKPIRRTRCVVEMHKMRYGRQEEILYRFLSLPGVRRAAIDKSGKGEQLHERAQERFGDWVEGVLFTVPVKSMLATRLRSGMEDRLVRIPKDLRVREDCHRVKRVVSPAGNILFDAERTKDGHCDRFWALALGDYAVCDSAGYVEPDVEVGEPVAAASLRGSGL